MNMINHRIFNPVKKFFKRQSFKNQHLMLYLIFSVIPILIAGGASMGVSSKSTREQIKLNTFQTIEQLSDNISSMLSLIEAVSIAIANNETVQWSLTNIHNNVPLSRLDKYNLEKALIGFYDYSIIRDILIFINESEYYYVPFGRTNRSIEIISDLRIPRNKTAWILNPQHEIIHIIRQVENSRYYYTIGTLCISISIDAIRNLFQKVNFGEQGEIIIMDGENNIITPQYFPVEHANKLKPRITGKSGNFSDHFKGENYMVFYHTAESTGWKTIGLISRKAFLTKLDQLWFTIGAVTVLVILVAAFCAQWVSKYFEKNIKRIIDAMEQAAKGNFSVRINQETNREFNIIHSHFNSMVGKIGSLIEEVYQTELSRKEAELRMLQAQINPHFLYNTLDTIFWQAQIAGQETISKTVVSLSNLLRMSVNNSKTLITVKEEITCIEDYVFIQKQRYRDKLTVDVSIEETLYTLLIPKLIIQPLVENAIIHGLESRRERCHITISGEKEGSYCRFVVSDNGRGISEDQVQKILETDNSRMSGIKNIHQRIRLRYGKNFGVVIASSPNGGTSVSVTIPLSLPGE
jgi:two-component system sensor histidine kinase YesM